MHQEFAPPVELSDTIKCFWYDSKEYGDVQTSFEVIPDGYAEIIFFLGKLGSVAVNGNLQSLPSPFMIGLLNKPATFFTQHRLQIIGARCYPWMVFDLLGLPSGKDKLRAFEHPIAQLQPIFDEYLKAGNFIEAISRLKQHFLDNRAGAISNKTLFKAGHAMNQANGTIPVSEVAAAAHTTVRTLERKFKQSSGHSVKDVSGLMRFEQVRNHLWLHPKTNLASLAHELGYADQAHLSREFKRYSGSTPAAFFRKTKAGKRIAGEDFIAFTPA